MIITPDTNIIQALEYAGREWSVFPLHSIRDGICTCGNTQCTNQGKHPRTQNGLTDATTDEQQIRAWWEKWPDANVGVATGNGLIVIDVDPKNGGSLEALGEIPETLTVKTGSGGYHLYYFLHKMYPFRNTSGDLSTGIDTRANGGYVVAPPSSNIKGTYTWLNDAPIVPLPPTLLMKLLEKKKRVQEEDADVWEEARNNYLTRQAGILRSTGMGAEELRVTLLKINEVRYGDDKHKDGPLSEDEIDRTILKSALKWEQGKMKETKQQPEEGRARPKIYSAKKLMETEIASTRTIVPGLVVEGVNLLVARQKMGKSWLVLNISLAVACGGKALGKIDVEKGDVLYVSLEDNEAAMQERLEQILGKEDPPDNLYLAHEWPPLNFGGVEELGKFLEEHTGTRLVVIDTLARVRPPSKGNVNAYYEDYGVITPLKSLADKHKVAIILVHHFRKSEGADPYDAVSGSTGLTGAADATILLRRERGKVEASLMVTGRKLREQELALSFDDERGMWSLVGQAAEVRRTEFENEALKVLTEHGPMSPSDYAKATDRKRETVKVQLSRMYTKAIIKYKDGKYYVTPVTSVPVVSGVTDVTTPPKLETNKLNGNSGNKNVEPLLPRSNGYIAQSTGNGNVGNAYPPINLVELGEYTGDDLEDHPF